jgi:hypothetical protein
VLPRKSASDSTSQPGWVAHEIRLSFSPKYNHWSSALKPNICWWIDYIGLLDPYHQHVISMFNTYSQGPTHRSLTDIDGGYNFGGADLPHHTPRPSQPMVSTFHIRALPDLRLSKTYQRFQCSSFMELMAATWSSDHSAIYHNLYLRLVIANGLSLAIGFTRIDQKVILMQLGYPFNSYNLMHNQESEIRLNYKQNSRIVVRCTRACLDHNNVSILQLDSCGPPNTHRTCSA